METFKLTVGFKDGGSKTFQRVKGALVDEGQLTLLLATGVPVTYKKGHWDGVQIGACSDG